MNRRLRYLLPAMALWGVAALLLNRPTAAQEPGADNDQAARTVREQSIYIPYQKLRQVFEQHGRGVFLPYEKFQELWEAARDKTARPAEPKPPVGALITEIDNRAAVAKDVVEVKARLKIEVLAEGWNEIPLRLSDAAITSATLGGQPARIIGGPGQNYKLLIEKKGKDPQQFELLLEYAKAIQRRPGQNSVSFQAPQAPVSRWEVRIPQSGVKVNIHPLIAAAEVPPAEDAPAGEDRAEETVLKAFVGAAAVVRIDWTPKAEGATGLAALASVQVEQQVFVAEGVTRTQTQLDYTISRAELAQLMIRVPSEQKVVNVVGDNVWQWSVEQAGGGQQITVQLFEPAKGSQQVTVKLEKFAGDQARRTVLAPVVEALDAAGRQSLGRQQGTVVVRLDGGLRAEAVKTEGLVQLDAAELSDVLKRGKWAFSYRYAAVPYDLQLSIEKVKPRIFVDSLVEVYLEPEKLSVDLLAIYEVDPERAGVFRLELDVPAGYDVRQVVGRAAAGAEAAEVDTHHLEGENNTRLIVNLSRKALGRVGLVVQLQKQLELPELLTPGDKVEIPLEIPRVVPGTVERDSGRLVVYAPESLEVNAVNSDGLSDVSLKEAMQGMESVRAKKPDDARPVLESAFTRGPVELTLSAKRRRPQVTIRQLLVARVESGVVKYEAAFFYDVLYSGVKSLRIDVPQPPGDHPSGESLRWRKKTGDVRDRVIDPPPEDLAEGYEAWSFTGETELIGRGKIVLTADRKIKKLDVGKSVDLQVPRLIARGADLAWGQIVLLKAETIDLDESDDPQQQKGLRPIDPQHDLIENTKIKGAARAFEFHDDWALTVKATMYELEEVKRTAIDRAVLQMVVTRAGEVSVRALYRMRSARQRLAVKLPPKADVQADPVRINGRAVLLQGQQGSYFVPLAGSNADESFVLELRYTAPFHAGRLYLPEFPEEPAVQKVCLCVYLPEEWDLLGTVGPWSEEFTWRVDWYDLLCHWRPVPRKVYDPDRGRVDLNADYLISWVAGEQKATSDFQTDGRLYIFSTLRPAATLKGSLKVVKMKEITLNALVFAAVILGGVLLLPAGTARRAVAIGALIVALVLCGVFLPTFSVQVLNGALGLAIFIVLVTWAVWYFARTRPRELAQRKAKQPPAPPPVPEAAPPSGSGQGSPSAEQPGADASSSAQPAAGGQDQTGTDQPGTDQTGKGGKTDE